MTQKPVTSKDGALSWDNYKPGDSIYTCQFAAKTPGQLIKSFIQGGQHTVASTVGLCFKTLPQM